LARSGFDTVAGELLRADSMPYSFTQTAADPARAREDLDEAIAVLVAGPEVNAALAHATAAMQADFTQQAFDRQVAAVKEKHALELRLANLVQANEDARALGPEGN
jgi:DNA primase